MSVEFKKRLVIPSKTDKGMRMYILLVPKRSISSNSDVIMGLKQLKDLSCTSFPQASQIVDAVTKSSGPRKPKKQTTKYANLRPLCWLAVSIFPVFQPRTYICLSTKIAPRESASLFYVHLRPLIKDSSSFYKHFLNTKAHRNIYILISQVHHRVNRKVPRIKVIEQTCG